MSPITVQTPEGVDLQVSQSASFELRAAEGLISSLSYIPKLGRNPDVDSSAEEDIWGVGGSRVYLPAEETMELASDNATDDILGDGALKVKLQGVDGNYQEVEEEIEMGGLTPVTTVQSFLRLNRIFVTGVGVGQSNVGAITIDPSVSGSGFRQGIISPGEGEALASHFTIPVGKFGFVPRIRASLIAATGGGVKDARICVWTRAFGSSWRLREDIGLQTDGTTGSDALKSGLRIFAKGDLKFTATVSNNNTEVSVNYTIYLADM